MKKSFLRKYQQISLASPLAEKVENVISERNISLDDFIREAVQRLLEDVQRNPKRPILRVSAVKEKLQKTETVTIYVSETIVKEFDKLASRLGIKQSTLARMIFSYELQKAKR